MRTSPLMQEFVTRLAEYHGFDLSVPTANGVEPLVVEQDGFMPITVEVLAPHVVQVSFYREAEEGDREERAQEGPDSVATFFTGDGEWTLIRAESPEEYMPSRFAVLDETRSAIVEVYNDDEQSLEARGCDRMAAQWEREGRLDRGRRRATV